MHNKSIPVLSGLLTLDLIDLTKVNTEKHAAMLTQGRVGVFEH